MHQIGSGVLGPVYRARRSDGGPPGDDRPVALKVFHVNLTPERTIVFGRALQHIVDLALSHPAVAGPVDAGVADGVPYLAYEYVAGDSLDVSMRSRVPVAAEAAMPCIVQVAEALDAAHGGGLVHGALHMRDVLVTADGSCVVGFGIVDALDRVGHRCPLRPPYAAPEQIAEAGWGAAADRYALAAVAWELLTGSRAAPGDGGTAGRLESVLGAETAARLTPLFEAGLAADPDRRPPSAGRLADGLAGALAWTGAPAARRGTGGGGGIGTGESQDGRGPERVQVVEGDPAVAGGGAGPPRGGAVAAAVGGTVMRKRGKRTPWRRKQAEGDWTKQALDLNPPDGRSGTEAGGARAEAPDAAAGEATFDGAGAGTDSIDEALDGRAAVDRPDAGGDLDLRTGGDPLADVAEGLHAGLRDGRAGAVADADAEDADLVPEPAAADGYAPISVGELESRVEGGAARPMAAGPAPEAASGLGYGEEAGGDEAGADESAPEGPAGAVSSEAADDGDAGGGAEFDLTPEEAYDYGPEDESEPEDPAGEIFGGGSGEQTSRLPVALVAAIGVAVAVTAFVIGLGWMGGDGGDAADVAEEATPAAPADDSDQAFTEEVVGGAVPDPAAAGADDADAAPGGAASPGGGSAGSGRAPGTARGTASAAPPPVRRPAPVPASPPPPVAPAPAPTPADGRLLVRSTPPGAEVIVNGEPRGTTPLALAALPHGPYEVEVTLAGYGSRRTQLVLDAGDPIGAWHADLTAAPAAPGAAGTAPARAPAAGAAPAAAQVAVGSIRAETRPPGAEVWLDQRLVGETPASIPDVPAGAHRIEFRLDGYSPWTTTVEVAPETQARVAASLADAAR